MATSEVLVLTAPAKINLGLEVLGRRPDGYHDLITILQEIDLTDELTFADGPDLVLSTDGFLGDPDDNLVLRAARLLQEASGTRRGATIHLTKRIPIAAGLGGGSSDAAATLVGLNRLWRLALPPSGLRALARQLGSDVPFFLQAGTQLATGRGDELQSLPAPSFAVVLAVTPTDFSDKTRRLYAALSPDDWSAGSRVRSIAEMLRKGQSLAGRALPSGFERAALDLFPRLADVLAAFRRLGAVPSLCGAGPTVLSLHAGDDEAGRVAAGLRGEGLDAIVTRTASGP